MAMLRTFARKLRRTMTPAELAFWHPAVMEAALKTVFDGRVVEGDMKRSR